MNTNSEISRDELGNLLDTLSVRQASVERIIANGGTSPKDIWTLADYLDLAAYHRPEKKTVLYRAVIRTVMQYIEENLYSSDVVQSLADGSGVFGDLVEAALQRDEQELTLDHEAISAETLEVLETARLVSSSAAGV